jgi:hypothetical protein
MIGNEIRDHTLVQQVFAEDPACMAAAFAAVDVLARAFGEHSVGVVIEPFVNPERSHVPTRLFVMAKTRLASAEADYPRWGPRARAPRQPRRRTAMAPGLGDLLPGRSPPARRGARRAASLGSRPMKKVLDRG